MLRAILASSTTSLATALLLIQGCGDSTHPAYAGNVNDATTPVEASSDAGPNDSEVTDALAPATELCQGLAGGGESIAEVSVPWDPPEMLGGTITPGTYDLVQLMTFATGAATDAGTGSSTAMLPTGRSAVATITIDEYVLSWVAGWDGLEQTSEAFLYSNEGPRLSLRSVCPTRDHEVVFAYSMVQDTLALLVDTQYLEIYSKR